MKAIFVKEIRIDSPIHEKEFWLIPESEEERAEQLLKAIDSLGYKYSDCEFELVPAKLILKHLPSND